MSTAKKIISTRTIKWDNGTTTAIGLDGGGYVILHCTTGSGYSRDHKGDGERAKCLIGANVEIGADGRGYSDEIIKMMDEKISPESREYGWHHKFGDFIKDEVPAEFFEYNR